jgi:hypothetical protein
LSETITTHASDEWFQENVSSETLSWQAIMSRMSMGRGRAKPGPHMNMPGSDLRWDDLNFAFCRAVPTVPEN